MAVRKIIEYIMLYPIGRFVVTCIDFVWRNFGYLHVETMLIDDIEFVCTDGYHIISTSIVDDRHEACFRLRVRAIGGWFNNTNNTLKMILYTIDGKTLMIGSDDLIIQRIRFNRASAKLIYARVNAMVDELLNGSSNELPEQ